MKRVIVTGSAGFIGSHVAELLLKEGHIVHGFDAITDYYDVTQKTRRHAEILAYENYSFTKAMLEDGSAFADAADAFKPDVIIHLAAQAGVRYSIENPRAYLDSNVIGTFNVMEAARVHSVDHLLMASTSSVYGTNRKMPFAETDRADQQVSMYAATKKANEAMAHAYANLYDLPTTMFRFFTVYGPWGRPDLAMFKFVDLILKGQPIDIYNHGDMFRDFTYVDDIARGICLLMDAVPERPASPEDIEPGDSLSPDAPFRVVNIGNSEKVRLLDFVDAIEESLGIKAKRNYTDMHPGDVPATWADASLLKRLTGYAPETDIKEGIDNFVAWYREFKGNNPDAG